VRERLNARNESDSSDGDLLLEGDSGKIWGAAVCTTEKVTNPVYISIGHKISLPTALNFCKVCSVHRIPEPVRQADIRSRAIIRQWLEEEESKKSDDDHNDNSAAEDKIIT